MSYYIHHKTKGYDFIDLTTNTVVRSFSISNTYNSKYWSCYCSKLSRGSLFKKWKCYKRLDYRIRS